MSPPHINLCLFLLFLLFLQVGINSWTCLPPFVAAGAIAALEGSDEDTKAMRGEFQARRDLVFDRLNAIEGVCAIVVCVCCVCVVVVVVCLCVLLWVAEGSTPCILTCVVPLLLLPSCHHLVFARLNTIEHHRTPLHHPTPSNT